MYFHSHPHFHSDCHHLHLNPPINFIINYFIQLIHPKYLLFLHLIIILNFILINSIIIHPINSIPNLITRFHFHFHFHFHLDHHHHYLFPQFHGRSIDFRNFLINQYHPCCLAPFSKTLKPLLQHLNFFQLKYHLYSEK